MNSISHIDLPPECKTYKILNETSRNRNYGLDDEAYCDNSLNNNVNSYWNGNSYIDLYDWYRMMPPAGTIIPEGVVPENKCGTCGSGWMNGIHPTGVSESTVG